MIKIPMKIFETYRELITETNVEACVKKFGYELFGHELGGKEKNTGLENVYVRDIQDFTDNQYGEETLPEFMSAIKNLKSCMKQYPEVLMPEKTKVYRGTTIPIKYFITKKEQIDTEKPFSYVYKAKSEIQSWSNNFKIASTFGNQNTFGDRNNINEIAKELKLDDYKTPQYRQELLQFLISRNLKIGFILEYTTNPNEFIFNSKYFKMLSTAHHEDELIRITNKPINVMIKFGKVFLSNEGVLLIKLINQAISEL
jgi:hypothetical protein